MEAEELARLDAYIAELAAKLPAAEVNRSTVIRAALAEYLRKEAK